MSDRLTRVRSRLEAIRQLRVERQGALAQLPADEQDAQRRRDHAELTAMLAETQALVGHLRPRMERAAGAAHVRAEACADGEWLDDGGAVAHLWEAAELDELDELEAWLREEAEHGRRC